MHFNKQNGAKNSSLITKAKSQIGTDFLRFIIVIVSSTKHMMVSVEMEAEHLVQTCFERCYAGLKGDYGAEESYMLSGFL